MVWAMMPPPQYVHPPHITVYEQRLGWPELHKMCGGPSNVLACSFFGTNGKKTVCFIVLPKDDSLNIAKLHTHEVAHCNGWPADHPGGHWENVSRAQSWW